MAKNQRKLLSTTPSTQKKVEETQVKKKKKKVQQSIVVASEDGSSSKKTSRSESDSQRCSETSPTLASPKRNKKREGESSREETNSKRVKMEIGASSTKMFQRIWTEEDELLLLQGMTKSEDVNELYELVKDSLSIEVKNIGQINSKINNLKKRYLTRLHKGGDATTFTKSHDRKCWDLSKNIWSTNPTVKSKRKTEVEKSIDEWFDKSFLVRWFVSVGLSSESAVIEDWEKLPLKNKEEVHEKGKLVESKQRECTKDKSGLFHDLSSYFIKFN